jgi:hypothetical protein
MVISVHDYFMYRISWSGNLVELVPSKYKFTDQ